MNKKKHSTNKKSEHKEEEKDFNIIIKANQFGIPLSFFNLDEKESNGKELSYLEKQTKFHECCILKPLLNHLGLDFSNVKSQERPDFIINETIGLELVRYSKDCAKLERKSNLNKLYKELETELHPHIGDCALNFKFKKRYKKTQEIKAEKEELIKEITALKNGEISKTDAKLVSYFSYCEIPDLDRCEITPTSAEWHEPLRLDEIKPCIEKKIQKLDDYKKENSNCNKFWLLVEITDFNLDIGKFKFESTIGYDKIFFFQNGGITEIK